MTSMDHGFASRRTPRNGETSSRQSDPLPRLLAQILERASATATIARAVSRPWASALFEGRRHLVTVRISGHDATLRHAQFVDGLSDAEWPLSGHFVADISIDDDRQDADGYLVELSALTIQDW